MELREEAWSPGPLDSEDQQMASHENPGEVALGSSSKLTPHPTLDRASFASLSPSHGSGVAVLPPEGSARPPPGPMWSLWVFPQLQVPGSPWGPPPPCPSWPGPPRPALLVFWVLCPVSGWPLSSCRQETP